MAAARCRPGWRFRCGRRKTGSLDGWTSGHAWTERLRCTATIEMNKMQVEWENPNRAWGSRGGVKAGREIRCDQVKHLPAPVQFMPWFSFLNLTQRTAIAIWKLLQMYGLQAKDKNKTEENTFVPYGGQGERNNTPNESSTLTICPIQWYHACPFHQHICYVCSHRVELQGWFQHCRHSFGA